MYLTKYIVPHYLSEENHANNACYENKKFYVSRRISLKWVDHWVVLFRKLLWAINNFFP